MQRGSFRKRFNNTMVVLALMGLTSFGAPSMVLGSDGPCAGPPIGSPVPTEPGPPIGSPVPTFSGSVTLADQALGSASVQLFTCVKGEAVFVAAHSTARDGSFLFDSLEEGDYFVLASTEGALAGRQVAEDSANPSALYSLGQASVDIRFR